MNLDHLITHAQVIMMYVVILTIPMTIGIGLMSYAVFWWRRRRKPTGGQNHRHVYITEDDRVTILAIFDDFHSLDAAARKGKLAELNDLLIRLQKRGDSAK